MNETSLTAPSAETVALHAELVLVSKDYHQAEHRLAVLLARMQADQRHRELGYANLVDYAEQELGLGRSTAFALAKVGRGLPTAPIVEQALAEGTLGWTKARELLKVVVPETEQQWVDFAKTSNSRDLEDQVRSAVPGDSPHVGTPKLPENGRMTISGATVDLEMIQDCIRWAARTPASPRTTSTTQRSSPRCSSAPSRPRRTPSSSRPAASGTASS
jgi:hypothetical protein